MIRFLNFSKRSLKIILPPLFVIIYRKFALNIKNRKSYCKIKGPYSIKQNSLDEQVWEENIWFEHSVNKLKKTLNNIDSGKSDKDLKKIETYFEKFILLLNILPFDKGTIKVLDFAGGTGRCWFTLLPYLHDYSRIDWYVVDQSQKLMNEGKIFASKNNLPSPIFLDMDSIANIERFDLIYVSSSLQYIDNLESLFDKLLEANPSFVVLQKLLISTKETQRFQQYFGKNSSTKCLYHSERKLLNYFSSKGYAPIVNQVNNYDRDSNVVHLPQDYKKYIGDRLAIDLVLKNIS